MEISEIKKNLRQEYLSRRNSLDENTREKASLYLTDRLLSDQWFYGSKKILIYKSYGSEIKTDYIIEEALRAGKAVFLPKVTGKEIKFIKIRSLDDVASGFKGIPEPQDGEEYEYHAENDTLVIMPGTVFDEFHNRYGYGGGYYDRFLKDKPSLQIRSIAVGFKCQMADKLETEDTDIKPYRILCV